MLRRTTAAALAAASAAAVSLMASPATAAVPIAVGSFTLFFPYSSVTCDSTLEGAWSGTAFTATGATATGCGVTVTPQGLPWSGDFGMPAWMSFSVKTAGCIYSATLANGVVVPPYIVFPAQPVTATNFPCFTGVTVSARYRPLWM